MKRMQAAVTPKEEVDRKACIFPLGEVRKVGQVESLCWSEGGGKTQKASHQFLTPVSCLCYSVAFSHTKAPC